MYKLWPTMFKARLIFFRVSIGAKKENQSNLNFKRFISIINHRNVLCSVSGLLSFATSGLTSFSGFKSVASVLTFRVLIIARSLLYKFTKFSSTLYR